MIGGAARDPGRDGDTENRAIAIDWISGSFQFLSLPKQFPDGGVIVSLACLENSSIEIIFYIDRQNVVLVNAPSLH